MKILFVSPGNCPFDPHQGSEQRSNLLLRACLKLGPVDVVCFCRDKIEDSLGTNIVYLHQLESNVFGPWNRWEKIRHMMVSWIPSRMTKIDRRKEKILDKIISQDAYDYIVIRYAFHAINCGLYKYAKKLVVDVDDNPAKAIYIWKNSSTTLGRLFYSIYSRNVIFAMKCFEKKIFKAFYSNKNDVRSNSVFLPNIPYYERDEMLPREMIQPHRILFVGDLCYPANIDAVNTFLKYSFPKILELVPDVTLHMVGQICDFHRKIFEQYKGVAVMGFVPSLEKEYGEASVVILPMRSGAGTCIKFVEAIQMGRPIVTSAAGYKGYESYFMDNEDCLVTNEDESFADAVIKVMVDEELQEKMAVSAFSKMKKYYSRQAFDAIVSIQLKSK